jgi:hypothetical protein
MMGEMRKHTYYNFLLNLMITLLLFLLSNASLAEDYLASDGYWTVKDNRTSRFNTIASDCGYQRFDYSLLSEALKIIAEAPVYELTKHPEATGIRVVYTYSIANYDDQGNQNLQEIEVVHVEITREGLLQINSQMHETFSKEALLYSTNCPASGATMWSPSEELLMSYMRVLNANGGLVAVNPNYFSLSFEGFNFLQ